MNTLQLIYGTSWKFHFSDCTLASPGPWLLLSLKRELTILESDYCYYSPNMLHIVQNVRSSLFFFTLEHDERVRGERPVEKVQEVFEIPGMQLDTLKCRTGGAALEHAAAHSSHTTAHAPTRHSRTFLFGGLHNCNFGCAE